MMMLSRVEEEKAINRALNGSGIPLPTNNHNDSNRQKSPPPAPVSRFGLLENLKY